LPQKWRQKGLRYMKPETQEWIEKAEGEP